MTIGFPAHPGLQPYRNTLIAWEFIKAEVIKLDNCQKHGSENGCREAGKLAIEGKEYIVEDGDIMHFRFNV